MKTQKFGIEIELTGITRKKAADVIAEYFGTEKFYIGTYYQTYGAKDRKGRTWKATFDSSIIAQRKKGGRREPASEEYKCEIVSPILEYEDLEDLQEIVRQLRHKGAFVSDQCGIHIHVDTHYNAQQLRSLTNIVASKEGLLKRAIQMYPERRTYCRNTNMSFVETINAYKNIDLNDIRKIWYDGEMWRMNRTYDPSRYVTLNLHSLWRRKGVEFRCFNSTVDTQMINSYILMTLAICNQAAHQTRASSRKSKSNDRLAMYNWLAQLGLVGPQFEALRHHFMGNLSADERTRVA